MSRWLDVTALQPPYDAGVLDGSGRAMWTFNVVVTKTPSATFQQELVSVLVGASVAVLGSTLFASSKSVLPSGPGPYLSINATGGMPGVKTQNEVAPAYERPSAQVTARAVTPGAAETLARAAYAALVAVRNQEVAA